MQNLIIYLKDNKRVIVWLMVGAVGLGWLLLYKLATLTSGMSANEISASLEPVGWHGIYADPLNLPLKLVQSFVFLAFPDHGQLLSRLPNVLLGASAVISMAWLLNAWHSTRTAVLTSLMFATSAWVLHVSRFVSFDVVYLWAMPTLLVTHVIIQKYAKHQAAWLGVLLMWGLLLYVPGMIWFMVVSAFINHSKIADAWRDYANNRQRLLYFITGIIALPLLVIHLIRSGQLALWLGLPTDLAAPLVLLKQLVAVPVHLFIRGPQYPEIWLDQLPILDIFTLVICGIGIIFYLSRWRAARSQLLGLYSVLGLVLVGIGGPVALSLLVPMLYIAAASGLAFLLREWLQVFPNNPLARGLGMTLISLAVVASCTYNLRAYFVAWPSNKTTQSVFQYHL